MALSDFTTEQIELRLQELRKKSAEYGEAHADVAYLERFEKAKLAILKKEYGVQGAKSDAAQETLARADPEYIKVLEALRDATGRKEKIRYELEIIKLIVGVWQTQQANERQEKRAYGS